MEHGKSGFFGWQILAEDSKSYFTFPIQVATEPVSDDEIKKFIRKNLISECALVSADEIENLVFIASNGDNMTIVEPLDPDDYWPTFEDSDYKKIYSNFRDRKGGEK